MVSLVPANVSYLKVESKMAEIFTSQDEAGFVVISSPTSALVSEVREEHVFLGEDKHSQPATGQRVVVNGARVRQDLPALVHHHPVRGKTSHVQKLILLPSEVCPFHCS